jgi:hypothetical protein
MARMDLGGYPEKRKDLGEHHIILKLGWRSPVSQLATRDAAWSVIHDLAHVEGSQAFAPDPLFKRSMESRIYSKT